MRRFFRELPIKHKLNSIMMLTSTLALLSAAGALLAHHAVTLRHSLEEELNTLAEVITTHSTAALAFNDPQAAAETLSALRANQAIVAGRIYRQDGTVFAEYFSTAERARAAPNEFPAPENDKSDNRQEGEYLVINKAVTLDGEPIGAVLIQASLSELHASVTRFSTISAGIILLSSILAFLFASKLQNVISSPIVRLAEAMKTVSREKDFSRRVEKHSNDEVGSLITGFNEMLSQIESRDEELERHRRHLEEQVKQRTQELRASMDEAYSLAFYDNLTGLANRLLLKDRIEQALGSAERHRAHAALLFFDLDRFKRINDTFGHPSGDLLLTKIAERLKGCVRQSDAIAHLRLDETNTCVSRLGGDEFCLLVTELNHPQDAAKVAQRLLDMISKPLNLEGYEVFVTTSIGISIFPEDGKNSDMLLKNADTAMYHAKEKGRNNYQFYEESMNAAALKRLTLENDLRRGLERGEFLLYYQPQVETHGNRIVGAEALLRWQHPTRGLVLPDEFIPVAEESGLIVPISEWLLKTVCAQILAWQADDLPFVRVSLNLSSHHFSMPSFFDSMVGAVEETGLAPHCLEVELTESTLMRNPEVAKIILHKLKKLGFCLAIDDFGTGYSSLSYLKTFPIDTLKIDRSFVGDITTDPDDAAIVRAIVAMAEQLELNVVAEGVETLEQLAFLRELGCHRIQGYLFSCPLPAPTFAGMLRGNEHISPLRTSRTKGRLSA